MQVFVCFNRNHIFADASGLCCKLLLLVSHVLKTLVVPGTCMSAACMLLFVCWRVRLNAVTKKQVSEASGSSQLIIDITQVCYVVCIDSSKYKTNSVRTVLWSILCSDTGLVCSHHFWKKDWNLRACGGRSCCLLVNIRLFSAATWFITCPSIMRLVTLWAQCLDTLDLTRFCLTEYFIQIVIHASDANLTKNLYLQWAADSSQ